MLELPLMMITQISAKQRRLKEWMQRIKQSPSQSLHIEFLDLLNQYRSLLAEIANQSECSLEQNKLLTDLERRLEKLDSAIRLERGSIGKSGVPSFN